MIKQSFISVLISSYNKENFIKKTINSCLNQNYNKFEIIVVDTASEDNSKVILNKFKKNKKIKLFFFKKKNLNIRLLIKFMRFRLV